MQQRPSRFLPSLNMVIQIRRFPLQLPPFVGSFSSYTQSQTFLLITKKLTIQIRQIARSRHRNLKKTGTVNMVKGDFKFWRAGLCLRGVEHFGGLPGKLLSKDNLSPFNSPYAWLRQTSKFHQQASFVNKIFCICTFCAWVFFSTLLPWEFISVKLRLFLISKRGLVVKFACVT